MIQPKPFKYVCQKCGYSKIVKPRSDVIDPRDLLLSVCPKCDIHMERKELVNIFDTIIDKLKGNF